MKVEDEEKHGSIDQESKRASLVARERPASERSVERALILSSPLLSLVKAVLTHFLFHGPPLRLFPSQKKERTFDRT